MYGVFPMDGDLAVYFGRSRVAIKPFDDFLECNVPLRMDPGRVEVQLRDHNIGTQIGPSAFYTYKIKAAATTSTHPAGHDPDFITSCKEGDFNEILNHLNAGAIDVNQEDAFGLTPAWYASTSPNAAAALALLWANGADVHKVPRGQTKSPLGMAIEAGAAPQLYDFCKSTLELMTSLEDSTRYVIHVYGVNLLLTSDVVMTMKKINLPLGM